MKMDLLKKINRDKLSPMMEQYVDIKEKYPDCIIFFRLGDFYEMFFDDAILVSKELEITLTARDCGQVEKAPMCGVPYHAAQGYLSKLIAKQYKVAICEQVEDPATTKGIVKREVVQIVTPGTQINIHELDAKRYNFLACIYQVDQYYGLAYADITTGLFEGTAILTGNTSQKLLDELERFQCSEVVCTSTFYESEVALYLKKHMTITLSGIEDSCFFRNDLTQYVDTEDSLCQSAGMGLLSYIEQTQLRIPANIGAMRVYEIQDFLMIDHIARKNLELTESLKDQNVKYSLLWVLDRTQTSMGGRYLREMLNRPLIHQADIETRLDRVEHLKDQYLLRQELIDVLKGMHDLERLAAKASMATMNPRDLGALSVSLSKLDLIVSIIDRDQSQTLKSLQEKLHNFTDLVDLLSQSLEDQLPISPKEGGIIRAGYHEEVDNYRALSQDTKAWLVEMEAVEKEKTGIKYLKIGYNRIFGYYLEVSKSSVQDVPERYQRKQTLASAERYITPELKELEMKLLSAEQRLVQLEYDLFIRIRETVFSYASKLMETARALAELDSYIALAEVAEREGYCRPSLGKDLRIDIQEGRHPVIEKLLPPGSFVPNDVLMEENRQFLLITGPNMSGKSTYMRAIAHIVILAQMGSFVPAKSAYIGLTDAIFTRIGASDYLALGQSTFMVEMAEMAHILNSATRKSLLLLDEIGRGTSTYDGLSIAWAMTEYLVHQKGIGSRTLFATHYHELIDLENQQERLKNIHVSVKRVDGDIRFSHRIKEGGTDDSYGIEVAKLAGVPLSVIDRAHEILAQLEQMHKDTGKKRTKKPVIQEGQMDLFSASMQFKQYDEILTELQTIDTQNMRALDALNLLDKLSHLAKKIQK